MNKEWINIDEEKPIVGSRILAAVYDEYYKEYNIMKLLVGERGGNIRYFSQAYEKRYGDDGKWPIGIVETGHIIPKLVHAWMELPKYE